MSSAQDSEPNRGRPRVGGHDAGRSVPANPESSAIVEPEEPGGARPGVRADDRAEHGLDLDLGLWPRTADELLERGQAVRRVRVRDSDPQRRPVFRSPLERLDELGPALDGDLETGRAGMAAMAKEELRATLEGGAEVQPAVAAARCPDDVAQLRADHRRAAEVVDQAAGAAPKPVLEKLISAQLTTA